MNVCTTCPSTVKARCAQRHYRWSDKQRSMNSNGSSFFDQISLLFSFFLFFFDGHRGKITLPNAPAYTLKTQHFNQFEDVFRIVQINLFCSKLSRSNHCAHRK